MNANSASHPPDDPCDDPGPKHVRAHSSALELRCSPHERGSVIHGIWGRPFIDLAPYLDLSALDLVHEEVCYSLAHVEVEYTGGCHRSMGIVPPSRPADTHGDYVEVLRRLDRREFLAFVSLAEDPGAYDPDRQHEYRFGEEQDTPLTRKQMLYLKYRHGVYFPWKVYYEMIPNLYWDEKSQGKAFTREARSLFPRTVALVRSLPFAEIGRCNIMGLEANDHGTVHRDGDPQEKPGVDHFITLCPTRNKRLFLWDDEAQREHAVAGRAYWFNDSDYHGVHADPFFRYSIRVDGVFRPDFLEALRSDHPINTDGRA
jgi:hypothetical protein